MIRALYNFIFYLFLPLMVLRLIWRSFKSPNYRKGIPERFACFKQPVFDNSVWIHAVSLGETIAVAPLVKKLQADYPNIKIVITNTTPTGSERVKALFADSVFNVYAPYDSPSIVKRFLNKVKPRLFVIVETELWPNYLHYCRKQGIPTILFNARLSDRSAKRYLKVKSIAQMMMNDLTQIIAQTELDANNFKKIGAPASKIAVTGSVKFDLVIPDVIYDKGLELRVVLGTDRPIWMAASTHEGEEKQILAAHAQILKLVPRALLILVPRHSDRFTQVANLCKESGFKVVRRSLNESYEADTSVYLGDTMGEMLLLYAVCDVAFVGGSFVSVGGHNMLEPAALKKPVLSGPCVINFLVISDLLIQAGGMQLVHTPDVLAEKILSLFQNPEQAKLMGERAFELVKNNRGSLDRQFGIIRGFLS